jgi:methyl-accepting chemotaxis protein
MFNMNLKTRLSTIFSIIIIVVSSFLVIWGVTSYRASSVESSETYLSQGVALKKKAFDELINSYFKIGQFAAKSIVIDENDDVDNKDVMSVFATVKELVDPLSVYFATAKGRHFSIAQGYFRTDFNAKDAGRTWHVGIVDKKLPRMITPPYKSNQGDMVMAVAVPMKRDGKVSGAMCYNLGVNQLSKYAAEIDVNNKLYLSNNEGFIFASADPEEIGKNLFEIRPEFKKYNAAGGTSEFDYNWTEKNNAKHRVVTTSLESLDWRLWQYESYAVITADSDHFFSISLIILLITIPLAVLIIYTITQSITNPIKGMAKSAEIIAGGDLTQEITVTSKDEVGILGNALIKMQKNLREIVGNIKINTDTVASASEELSAVSTQILSGSSEMITQSGNVQTSTDEVSENISAMASASEEMSVNANEVAGAAEEMSVNMNAVSSAVEEMSVSIGQIAQDAGTAKEVAGKATESSLKANSTMSTLSDAAKEIGNVTEVIKRIAEQTNLLALNATIEAASAGEAGKGFAVVANEIKELANQSAKAADDIAARIDGVQANTEAAVDVISGVSSVIDQIGSTVNNIAQAVEQQSSAVNDISANVTQAGTGVEAIASAISEVAKGANDVSSSASQVIQSISEGDVGTSINKIKSLSGDTNNSAKQISGSSDDLSKMSGDLQVIVGNFTV